MYKMYFFKQNRVKNRYAIFLIIFAIFLILSLISYSALDPCLHVINNHNVRNLMGRFGAILSDLFFQYFGLSSYLFPLVLLYWSTVILLTGYLNLPKIKILCLIISVIILSIVFGSFQEYNFKFQMLPGGYIGYAINNSTFSQIIPKFVFIIILLSIFTLSIFVVYFSFSGYKKVTKNDYHQNNTNDSQKNNITFLTILKSFLFLFKINKSKKNEDEILLKHRRKIPSLLRSNKEKKSNIEKIKKDGLDIESLSQKHGSKFNNIYKAPSIEFLNDIENRILGENQAFIEERIAKLSQTLREFGIKGDVLGHQTGPIVTLYEFKPKAGIKASRIIGLSDDIARNMKVESIRISTIAGKDTLGMEIPNNQRAIVSFKKIVNCERFINHSGKLPIILGSNIFGSPIVVDLVTMPHLLVAGTTGSGKSVGINTIVLSLLYRLSPKECKFVMIDPKMLELSPYNGIPHLVTPVITEAQKAVLALKWVVREMEDRYRKMSTVMVKNIDGYNAKVLSGRLDSTEYEYLAYIVVIIDEMADLMLVSGKEVEILVQRLSQMARAAGIHLIMATQRPSVDVITGVIKANFPVRISYQVTSKIDSRTIIGEQGAEQLLGKGDMLFMSSGGKNLRIHGPLIVDNEVERVVDFFKNNYETDYIELEVPNDDSDIGSFDNNTDDTYKAAIEIVLRDKKTSISYLQRKLRIGYNKAANLIEKMEEDGILTEADHSGKREIVQ